MTKLTEKNESKVLTGGIKFLLKISEKMEIRTYGKYDYKCFSNDPFSNLFPIRISEENVSLGDLLCVANGEIVI